MLSRISQTVNPSFYPDLQERDGLAPALQCVLMQLGSRLLVRKFDAPRFCAYASLHTGQRFSSVMVAEGKRAFYVDFWDQGVPCAAGWISQLSEVGRAIVAFHVRGSPIQDLVSQFVWLTVNPTEFIPESSVEYFLTGAWQSLEERLKVEGDHWLAHELLALTTEAAQRPQLRQLLPFRSLYHLCFSRTTGYPFTRDCPVAHPVEPGIFRTVSPDGQRCLGRGDAVQAVDILIANLPPNCGPARHGTDVRG